MNILLAQLDQAPIQLAAWCASLAFILMLFNQGAKFLATVKGKPGQPPNEVLQGHIEAIKAHIGDPMPKSECERAMDSLSTTAAQVKSDLTDHQAAVSTLREKDIAEIYRRINNVHDETARSFAAVERSLGRIEGQVNEIAKKV